MADLTWIVVFIVAVVIIVVFYPGYRERRKTKGHGSYLFYARYRMYQSAKAQMPFEGYLSSAKDLVNYDDLSMLQSALGADTRALMRRFSDPRKRLKCKRCKLYYDCGCQCLDCSSGQHKACRQYSAGNCLCECSECKLKKHWECKTGLCNANKKCREDKRCKCQNPLWTEIYLGWRMYYLNAQIPTPTMFTNRENLLISDNPLDVEAFRIETNVKKRSILDLQGGVDVFDGDLKGSYRGMHDKRHVWVVIPKNQEEGTFDIAPGELEFVGEVAEAVAQIKSAAIC